MRLSPLLAIGPQKVRAEIKRRLNKNAETGQRGYLLTQDESYLTPFERAESQIKEELAQLTRTLSCHEQPNSDLDQVVALSFHELNELRKTVDLTRSGHLDQALEVVRNGHGKELMDQIRDHAARIEQQERRSVEAAQRALQRAGIQRSAVFFGVPISKAGLC